MKKKERYQDIRTMSVTQKDAKKPFVTKASDNDISESHVTGKYTPIYYDLVYYKSIYTLTESVLLNN